MELLKKANGNIPRSEEEKERMIKEAAEYYGQFLTALGFDWKADPNQCDTPTRVAKSWIKSLISGCVNEPPIITSFPSEDYEGMICQTYIPIRSMCSHHALPIAGFCHVAYIGGKGGRVIGLSKLNKIVGFISRRPQIQEIMTQQIHDYINTVCNNNRGVAVMISCKHFCTCHRDLYEDSVMNTMTLSGLFQTNELQSKNEFLKHIELAKI